MSIVSLESLEQRVRTLEGRNRWYRSLLTVCLAALLVVVAGGAQVIKDSLEIREQLLVHDRNGTVRFDMGVERKDGLSNGLILFDRDGKKRIALSVNDRGEAALSFYDRDENHIKSFP